MKKSDRISQYIAALGLPADSGLPECYLGYFACFNAGEYYEAHDVLEHLWLQGRNENYHFFKALIQIAGAFVHLRKQYLRPEHPTDGRRLFPAVRLFRLALGNLGSYPSHYLQLDVDALRHFCHRWMDEILAHDHTRNPWSPQHIPRLELQPLALG